jgi:hypothetical protein
LGVVTTVVAEDGRVEEETTGLLELVSELKLDVSVIEIGAATASVVSAVLPSVEPALASDEAASELVVTVDVTVSTSTSGAFTAVVKSVKVFCWLVESVIA